MQPEPSTASLDKMVERLQDDHGTNTILVTNSECLLKLAWDARKRESNRQANIEALTEGIDPDGVHVLLMSMVHNDCEMRTHWLVRERGGDLHNPARLWLDVSFDAWERYVRPMKVAKKAQA